MNLNIQNNIGYKVVSLLLIITLLSQTIAYASPSQEILRAPIDEKRERLMPVVVEAAGEVVTSAVEKELVPAPQITRALQPKKLSELLELDKAVAENAKELFKLLRITEARPLLPVLTKQIVALGKAMRESKTHKESQATDDPLSLWQEFKKILQGDSLKEVKMPTIKKRLPSVVPVEDIDRYKKQMEGLFTALTNARGTDLAVTVLESIKNLPKVSNELNSEIAWRLIEEYGLDRFSKTIDMSDEMKEAIDIVEERIFWIPVNSAKEAYEKGKSKEIRTTFADLEANRIPSAGDLLKEALYDENASVRESAVNGLSSYTPQDAFRILLETAIFDDSEKVRSSANIYLNSCELPTMDFSLVYFLIVMRNMLLDRSSLPYKQSTQKIMDEYVERIDKVINSLTGRLDTRESFCGYTSEKAVEFNEWLVDNRNEVKALASMKGTSYWFRKIAHSKGIEKDVFLNSFRVLLEIINGGYVLDIKLHQILQKLFSGNDREILYALDQMLKDNFDRKYLPSGHERLLIETILMWLRGANYGTVSLFASSVYSRISGEEGVDISLEDALSVLQEDEGKEGAVSSGRTIYEILGEGEGWDRVKTILNSEPFSFDADIIKELTLQDVRKKWAKLLQENRDLRTDQGKISLQEEEKRQGHINAKWNDIKAIVTSAQKARSDI